MGTTMAVGLRIVLACCGFALTNVPTASATGTARHFADLVYATVAGKALSLDLHLPPGVPHPPLLIFVHGGAWTTMRDHSFRDAPVERVVQFVKRTIGWS